MSNSQCSMLLLQSQSYSFHSLHELELARSRIDPHKQRITQTNMVYMIGIPDWMAAQNILRSYEYCGQYGDIEKVMIKKTYFNELPSYSAYVTFTSEEAACLAVLGINNMVFDRNRIYASYGTNKYCAQYIKFGKCRKEQCPFIHEIAPGKEIYEDDNKRIFQGQQDLARSYFIENYSRMGMMSVQGCVFPSFDNILNGFIQSGYITVAKKQTDIREVPKPIDRKSSTSTLSSPLKQKDEEQSDSFSIEGRILQKLLKKKNSIFKFICMENVQAERVEDMLRKGIQAPVTLSC